MALNLTESLETVLQMALRHGAEHGVTPQQRQALLKGGLKIRLMRYRLDRSRAAARQRSALLSNEAGAVSVQDLHQAIRQVLPCHECGVIAGNPWFACTRGFECCLQRLRLPGFSQFHPPQS